MIWLEFCACAIVIFLAGSQLAKHGDVIAERTGLGKEWIGLVLLATITSLPDLFTGVSAVTFHDLPDMAVSGVIGSCMFNMMTIAILDLVSKKEPISHRVHQGHMISAGFGIVLMGFAAMDILFGRHLPVLTCLNNTDPLSIVFIGVYLLSMKLIYSYERHRLQEFAGTAGPAPVEPTSSLRKSVILFVVNSIIIVATACLLPGFGEQIAKITGWGESFIGSSFIAISTSLPELAVSFTCARRGSFDMAVASLLGSNLFNIAILGILDFCYVKQPLLRAVSPINTIAALAAMITMGIAVIGLTYRSEKKYFFLGGDAIAILLVYILANVLLFIAH
jgi:cation:H+ antiporter